PSSSPSVHPSSPPTTPTHTYTLSLHDALPISSQPTAQVEHAFDTLFNPATPHTGQAHPPRSTRGGHPWPGSCSPSPSPSKSPPPDRKSTRLNSSHVKISYAVFCLKKKNKTPHD